MWLGRRRDLDRNPTVIHLAQVLVAQAGSQLVGSGWIAPSDVEGEFQRPADGLDDAGGGGGLPGGVLQRQLDVRALFEGCQFQGDPQASAVRIGLRPQIEQTGLRRFRPFSASGFVVWIGEEELHAAIITTNDLAALRYNSAMSKLTHLDESGRAHMVDVGRKPETERMAMARGEVRMQSSTLELIRQGTLKKGDVLTVAQVAGIAAAKRTSELIPLCHPLPLSHIDVSLALDEGLPGVVISATVRTTGRTGVEMEALTAVSVAALTVYDMAKSAEKTMRIQNIRLVEKHGGQSGDVVNED
jgi:cyclic pyranopterin phosphate synthase